MDNALITVVLPIYNTEKYLDQCIASVTGQTYFNLEILLIDDGSPDNCPQVCDAWAEKDSRIRVIHKQNEGLGYARNTGIENARGEYICFFDSDDYIAPDTIEKAYEKLKETDAEVVSFGFCTVDQSGTVLNSFKPAMAQEVYRGDQVQEEFLPELIAPDPHGTGQRRLYMSAWSMLYSMKLIQNYGWRFVSERDIISEDVYSLLDLFSNVQNVAVLPEALYYYRTNQGSLTRTYRPNRYDAILHFYQMAITLCKQKNYSDDILHRVSDPFLGFTIAAMKQEAAVQLPEKDKRRNLKRIMADNTLQHVLDDIRSDKVKWKRRVLFFVIRNQWYYVCRILLWLNR